MATRGVKVMQRDNESVNKPRRNWFVIASTFCFFVIAGGVIFYTAAQHTPHAQFEQTVRTPAFMPTSPPPPTTGPEPTTMDVTAHNKITSRDDAIIRVGGFPPFIFGNDVYVKRFPNRDIVGGAWSNQENLAIWVVSINGKVRVGLPGWPLEPTDGVTYIYDEETGFLLGVIGEFRELK